MKLYTRFIIVLLLLFPFLVMGQQEKVDLNMIYKIKQEGFRKSQIKELSFWMTDYMGPRLPGSEGMKRALDWTSNKMKEIGLENVRVDPWGEIGPGWKNTKTYIAMTAPYYSPLIGMPKAWSPGTNGSIKSEVILVDIKDTTDFDKYRGKLKGMIVTAPPVEETRMPFEVTDDRFTDTQLTDMAKYSYSQRPFGNFDFERFRRERELRNKINSFIVSEGVAAILSSSGTSFGTVRVTGVNTRGQQGPGVPEIVLTSEHHGRIVRLIQHDIKVEVEMDIANSFMNDDKNDYNVIGEIPGTDKNLKNQIVLIGAHLDCWHGGTGADDNASGCIIMMEAMRILKAIGFQPWRTVQIALWGSEESGLRGSRGYVTKYLGDPETMVTKPGYNNFSVYFNIDNGSGKIRGIHLQENDMVRPIFEAWFKPFSDMGASTIALSNTGGTDHQSFDALGLPAFQFIQDPVGYDKGYHSNMDTYERLMFDDMIFDAVVVASFVYNAAMRDELMPRKPLPEPRPRREF
jgi:carboxypeptidase Q